MTEGAVSLLPRNSLLIRSGVNPYKVDEAIVSKEMLDEYTSPLGLPRSLHALSPRLHSFDLENGSEQPSAASCRRSTVQVSGFSIN